MAKKPKVIKIRLELTEQQIYDLNRIKRWEKESENTNIELRTRPDY